MPSNRLTPDELTALEELVAKMTRGEWRAGRPDMTSYEAFGDGEPFKNIYVDDPRGGWHEPTGGPLPYTVGRGEGDECHENAQGIAALRNAAPALLAMARLCYQLENDRAKAADLIPKILENLDEPELADILRKAIHAP